MRFRSPNSWGSRGQSERPRPLSRAGIPLRIPPFSFSKQRRAQTRGTKLKSDKQILEELKHASAGLLVMSESDYPFELIEWSGRTAITPEYLCRISDRPKATRIGETDTKQFL